jgi:hypothetical protein
MNTNLITWILLNYGLMNIMVYSSIFKGLRDFFKEWSLNKYSPFYYVAEFISGILSCPMCFSFHGGWFFSLTIFSPLFELYNTPTYISWFFDGVLASGSVWALNSIIEWFEENRPTKHIL